MKKICLLMLFCIMYLCACSEKTDKEDGQYDENVYVAQSSNDLFDENGNSTERIALSYGFLNGDSFILENENNVVNTRMFLETENNELEIGLIFYVDGIIQPVSIDGAEESVFNVVKINEKKEIEIAFEMVSGHNDEMVRIDAVSVLNPNFKITSKTKQFGLCFSSISPLPYSTKCEKDVPGVIGASVYEKEDISEEMRSKYYIRKSDGTFDNHLESNMAIEYIQNGDVVNKLKCSGDKLEFDLNIAGGIWDEYNIYVFLNNQVLNCFEGYNFNTITTNSETATKINVNADISEVMTEEYSQVFVMAVPVGEIKDQDVCVYKLANIVVEKMSDSYSMLQNGD